MPTRAPPVATASHRAWFLVFIEASFSESTRRPRAGSQDTLGTSDVNVNPAGCLHAHSAYTATRGALNANARSYAGANNDCVKKVCAVDPCCWQTQWDSIGCGRHEEPEHVPDGTVAVELPV